MQWLFSCCTMVMQWWRPVFKKCFLFLFFIVSVAGSRGQQRIDTTFCQPLDIPVLLSATFAELRANHLHSGIDFRTQGATGHKVYAGERGYVSRIAVSPTGYGKALYINHPEGYTTVYAHLESFSEDIAAYVKQQQYRQERFAVNLFPAPDRFPVKRGEVIGFSGNSGGSSGPHLHFEVRDTRTQHIINPLLFGFGVKDNIPPTIRRLAVYPAGKNSRVNGSSERLLLNVEKSGKDYRITGNPVLKVIGKVAFGIDTYDQTYGSANRCGPYHISFRTDSILMFSQTMNRFSFDETRYVNSLIDYAHYIKNQNRINRLYIEPNNQLSVYDRHTDRGIVSFSDSAAHTGLVVVRDIHGNTSRLSFSFVYVPDRTPGEPSPFYIPEPSLVPGLITESYRKEFVFTRQGVRVVIPADALYDEIDFNCEVFRQPKELYSEIYRIHDAGIPLHKPITIEIAADSLPGRLHDKALIVLIAPDGKRSYAGGTYRNRVVATESRLFGDYAIGADTVPPRITPLNIRNGANMRGEQSIRFRIKDDFSGIRTCNGQIDGRWALFEYDAKNDVIFYYFDADKLTPNTQHTLQLQVTDNKGNAAGYTAKFTW